MTVRLTDLDDPAWLRLFTDVESSWFRLETLQHYAVDYEEEEYAAFLATGRLSQPVGAWQQMITEHTRTGRRLRRVHVVEDPPTAYLRYELACYQRNAHAGEDIRLVPTPRGTWPTTLPRALDYWLFDDTNAWTMLYDPHGRFIAAEQTTDPTIVAQYRGWRDSALAQSIPLGEYLTRAA